MTNSNDIIIELKNVTKTFNGKDAVKDASLRIKRGEFVTLLGPSGCGKTTTLRMIAGFEMPTQGKIFFDGKDITDTPPHLRKVNTVFQRYALFPHLNVFKNIAFGLKLKAVPDTVKYNKKGERVQTMRKLTKTEIREKVNAALKMVDLEDYGHRSVTSLSGGQQQRVAIARAIVNEPEVLLLDEPLGALDLKMRKDMQLELMNMHNTLGITFIYVTHDQEEALTMSDKIVVMRDGVIQQIATPETIYDEPANAFVADFIGESNILSGIMLEDFKVKFCDEVFECVDKGFKHNEPIDVIIRPEDFRIRKVNDAKSLLKATVTSCVFKGDHYQITVIANENELVVHDTQYVEAGDEIGLYIKPFDLHIMRKSRIINTVETYMVSENVVDICGGHFDCTSTLDAGTLVTVKVDFDDVDITDDEADGVIPGTVVSSIYKGSYYQCIVRTDDYYDFFVDTDDDWLKGDRVGINIPKDKIIIEKREEIAATLPPSTPQVVDQTVGDDIEQSAPVEKHSLEEAAAIITAERYGIATTEKAETIAAADVTDDKAEETAKETTPIETAPAVTAPEKDEAVTATKDAKEEIVEQISPIEAVSALVEKPKTEKKKTTKKTANATVNTEQKDKTAEVKAKDKKAEVKVEQRVDEAVKTTKAKSVSADKTSAKVVAQSAVKIQKPKAAQKIADEMPQNEKVEVTKTEVKPTKAAKSASTKKAATETTAKPTAKAASGKATSKTTAPKVETTSAKRATVQRAAGVPRAAKTTTKTKNTEAK